MSVAENLPSVPAREAERRRTRRVSVGRPIQYLHGGRVHNDVVEEISAGGLRLRGDHPVPTCGSLKLFVPVPLLDPRRVRMCLVEGLLVWRGSRGAGVRFLDLPPDSRAPLEEYLRRAT